MKHQLNLIVTILCIAPTFCNAMENKALLTPAKILTTITSMRKPKQVICFPNDIVAIKGKDGCRLYDCATCDHATDEKFTQLPIDPSSVHGIAALPHKQLLAIRNNTDHNIIIFDTSTGNKIGESHSTKYISTLPIFNPTDDTIITISGNNTHRIFNYKNNTLKKHYKSDTPMAFHPTQQGHVLYTNHKRITLQELNEDSFTIKKTFDMPDVIYDCMYNPDGSLIGVVNTNSKLILLDSTTGRGKDKPFRNLSLYAMAFHPSNFILATFSFTNPDDPTGIISYWNTKTMSVLAQTKLKLILFSPTYDAQLMDFFCDGTKLIVALKHRCLVLEVPFDALYQPNTKNKCRFADLILQNYHYDNENVLPNDVKHLVVKYLLAASRYSLTNY